VRTDKMMKGLLEQEVRLFVVVVVAFVGFFVLKELPSGG
jgi:hypothetical protein